MRLKKIHYDLFFSYIILYYIFFVLFFLVNLKRFVFLNFEPPEFAIVSVAFCTAEKAFCGLSTDIFVATLSAITVAK